MNLTDKINTTEYNNMFTLKYVKNTYIKQDDILSEILL